MIRSENSDALYALVLPKMPGGQELQGAFSQTLTHSFDK